MARGNKERYEENDTTTIVMNCKKKICDLIKILIDIASDFNMRKFIFDFKKSLQNEGEESKGHKKKF